MNAALAYYVTAHGYGHGVRSCDILRAFHAAHPEVPILVVSDLPESFLRNRLRSDRIRIRPGAFDVGMVQMDSIRVDVAATLSRVEALYARQGALVEQEVAFYRQEGVGLVVCDVPAIPLGAAAQAGLPRLAVGNFAWDWIYGDFIKSDPRWRPYVELLAEDYAKTELLLRLPFSEPMTAFPKHQPIELVADPGTERRAELVELTGADPAKKWILLSFTSLDWSKEALARVTALDAYEFFTVHPLSWTGSNMRTVEREKVSFPDVVASVDGVVSKPGFGLLSECIVNGKPLLYADRTDFVEYPILVDALERYLQNVHIPVADLYAGDLYGYLEQLWCAPQPTDRIGRAGAAMATRAMAERLGLEPASV